MRHAGLKVEGRIAHRRNDMHSGLYSVPEFLDQKFQARLPDLAQLVKRFAELLQAILPLLRILLFPTEQFLVPFSGRRKLDADSFGEIANV
jgi:hypothetical protein